jgi:uncharacterized protein YndB with AHSA1/START domain
MMVCMHMNGDAILGSLRSADGAGIVRIENRYATGVDDLWSALTEPARLSRWYGDVEGDLRPGGDFHLRIPADGWDGIGRVNACEPRRRLQVTTRESDASSEGGQGARPFDDFIEATLTADGGETVLVIEVRGLPLDKIEYSGVGWQIHAEALARHLAGQERGDMEPRWAELIPPYRKLAAAIR